MRLSLAILLGVLLSANALAFKADAPIGNAVNLQDSIVGDKHVFQIAGRVPVELSFSVPRPIVYQVDTAQYDRSVHMESERFSVAPGVLFHMFTGAVGPAMSR